MGHRHHRQTQKHRKHQGDTSGAGGHAEPRFHSRFERFLYLLRHPPLAAFFTPTPERPEPEEVLPARKKTPALHSTFSKEAPVKRRMPPSQEHPPERSSSGTK
jgi:hypothetical protein